MATSAYPSGLFHQEQSFFREYQTLLPSPERRIEISRPGHLIRSRMLEDPRKGMGWMLESDQYVKLDSTIRRPVLIDVQEIRPDSLLFSFGIADKCTSQQSISRFLRSGPSEAEREEMDFSLLSDIGGLGTCNIFMHRPNTPMEHRFCLVRHDEYQSSLVHPKSELCSKTPPVDFIENLSSNLKTTAQDQVSFSRTKPEMEDLRSIIEELYPPNNSAKLRNQPLLVPYFTRTEASEATENTQGFSSKLQSVTINPLKSPKKIKLNVSPKKRNCRKAGKERDLYKRSYFHACESLLSLVLDKRHGNTVMFSLTKSDPEIPQVLNQFSAGIAGTGLAILLSVVCKVAGGRVPFCASKLLNTGFGFGLVWLSWAVNKLRDSVIFISKNSSKAGVKDKEMIRRVDKSVKEMFFRAATVMVIWMLRFA
ncbi:Helicase [Thalictrum thalictroides]|uniref:Helicase n=1 Tax=Thalictrum thalictroides TaxID=46969 RepID=A0A7J6WHH2_THATH|nr:Helicase [Thalictrum thalictroides]